MNYIYYQTKTQFENAGDVLINKALIENLREFGSLKCNCSKSISNEFIKELGILDDEKIECKNGFSYMINIFKQSVKAKKNKSKVYIVSGLGHQWGGNFKTYLRNISAGLIFALYRLLGIRIIKIGMSIGPISKWQGITEKFRSKFINYYYVRDTKSLNLCNQIGIKKAKICPDMSWLYLNRKEKKLNNNNIISVSLRESVLNEKDNKYVEKMLEKCDLILKNLNKELDNKMKVIFYYQVKRDYDFCKKAYEYFKEKYDCEFIDNQFILSTVEKVYSKTSYNISNRMHSLLLGYKYGSLPIAIIDTEKHIKISQTLIDNNLNDFIVDVYNAEEKNIRDIINNKSGLFNKLINVEQESTNEILKILREIFLDKERGE